MSVDRGNGRRVERKKGNKKARSGLLYREHHLYNYFRLGGYLCEKGFQALKIAGI